MQSERWQKCIEIFQGVLERPVAERTAFIAQSCDGDEALRVNVESMLEADEEAGDFIQSSALEAAPEFFVHDPDALIGQHLGSYRIDAVLGIGGMGVVYLAYDERLGRKVGLKLMPPSLVADEARLERLEREARTASALNHPNIVTVYEIGEVDGTHYIATECIEGITLREQIAKGPIPPNDALEIAIQLASALCVAHQAAIVHRDIKPENIMLRPDGYVKVLDFGIAKFTQPETWAGKTAAGLQVTTHPGMILGTTRYMSPEQARGRPVDARTDVWSLGVILYEMLTGGPPFEGETPTDIMAAVLTKEPLPLAQHALDVPANLQRALEKTLQKDKKERYQSAGELLDDLRHLKQEFDARWGPHVVYRSIGTNPAAGALRPKSPAASPSQVAAPEKSIAVLPFENLSDDKENAYFASGVQDEILTNLSRIAELKVISRTSVMQYKSGLPRNLAEIGQQLGVAHVLEGSVQRATGQVRVNAQLIDARNDAHLWAQTYDRDLADVFAIQSEIAKAIADQLQAKLSPSEEKAIDRPPTSDITAFDLYTRAKDIYLVTGLTSNIPAMLLQALALLNEAVTRDSSFFEAYCLLAALHDRLYFIGHDHTPARRAMAEAALDAAFKLRSDAGEAHLARAWHFYNSYEYEAALAELEVAGRTLPNHPRVPEMTGYVVRRQNKREEAVKHLLRALELDPRNCFILQQLALTYQHLRRYGDMADAFERSLAIRPDDIAARVARAAVELEWKANPRPLHQVIDSILAENPGVIPNVADSWFKCALAERDAAAAERALVAMGVNEVAFDAAVFLNRHFAQGLIARMTNDGVKAHAAFTAARTEQEKIVEKQPDYAPALCVLGLIDAALGRKEEALREARRAVELCPISKDAVNGIHMIAFGAMTAAWVGDNDLACQQLAEATSQPGYLSYGQLKLLPDWDPLRGDPRFERIVADLAPEPRTRSGAIAVLPLRNVSGQPDDEYFADGMTEALISDLAKVGALKVISRGSVMNFKGTSQPLAEIGRALEVEFLVEGSVLRDQHRVRISARLVRAATDECLWAERYDRALADVLTLQDEVARAIAHAIDQKLHRVAGTAPRRVDPEVYLLDLRGRHYWHQRTETGFRTAFRLYEEAIARDPTYAPAHLGIAGSLNMLANYGIVPPQDVRPRALAAVQRALTLDERSAEAHAVLAFCHWQFDFAWDAAIAEYEHALELAPNSPTTTYWFGAYLGVIGFFERSHELLAQAQELDPLSLIVPSVQGWVRFFARRFDEAVPICRQVLRIDPDFHVALWFLGEALIELAQYEEGLRALERAYELGGRTSRLLGYLGYAYGRAGQIDRGRECLAELEAREQSAYVPPYFPALILSGLGESDRALERLEQAYRQRDTMLRDLKADAAWDRMRSLPKFEALMWQMAFPDSDKVRSGRRSRHQRESRAQEKQGEQASPGGLHTS